jgi:hypothetical protein
MKPEVTVQSDYARGSQRFLLSWDGYDKNVFNLIKQAGGKYEKPPGATKGVTWCPPSTLRQCIENLLQNEYIVHNTVVDLATIESQTETSAPLTKEYEIIRVTDYSIVINFSYGPKFYKMVEAIKRIHLDDREFDPYTKDWKIRHKALPTLIWGWKELGIDVERLEAIKRLVCIQN